VVMQCLTVCGLQTIVCSCGALWLLDCIGNRVEGNMLSGLCVTLSPGEGDGYD
jgi:hypothetical protein